MDENLSVIPLTKILGLLKKYKSVGLLLFFDKNIYFCIVKQ